MKNLIWNTFPCLSRAVDIRLNTWQFDQIAREKEKKLHYESVFMRDLIYTSWHLISRKIWPKPIFFIVEKTCSISWRNNMNELFEAINYTANKIYRAYSTHLAEFKREIVINKKMIKTIINEGHYLTVHYSYRTADLYANFRPYSPKCIKLKPKTVGIQFSISSYRIMTLINQPYQPRSNEQRSDFQCESLNL